MGVKFFIAVTFDSCHCLTDGRCEFDHDRTSSWASNQALLLQNALKIKILTAVKLSVNLMVFLRDYSTLATLKGNSHLYRNFSKLFLFKFDSCHI